MDQQVYMESLIKAFPDMMHQMLSTPLTAVASSTAAYNAVVIAGQGGSGIGGSFAAEWLSSSASCPIVVCKNYTLPGFLNKNSLIIICSYSGNTEEALSAYQQAKNSGAEVICISTGGKLVQQAQNDKVQYTLMPGGQPPRASMGFSLVALFQVLVVKGVANQQVIEQLTGAANWLKQHENAIQDAAWSLAQDLLGTIPVLYSGTEYEPVAIRWRQQINENSKMLCWHHAFPEMNHNELVGWAQDYTDCAVVMLTADDDYARNKLRMEICKPIFEKLCKGVFEVRAQGNNMIERAMYLVYFGDWVSVGLSKLEEIDPVEVNVINYLKNELSKD